MKDLTRKKLVREYMETYRPMGIYQIKNNVNGKCLIGRSMNLDGIINRNKFTLKMGMHINKQLQQEWNEYGEENFTLSVIDKITPKEDYIADSTELDKFREELEVLEDIWLEKLQPYDEHGYHIRKYN